jgi:iron complex transport system substrate-binding protein
MRRVRGVPAIVVALLVAGGCSSGSDAPSGGTADGSATPTTHVVRDTIGSVEVPSDPQRVVVIAQDALDAAVALGVTPVGAPRLDNSAGGLLSYLEDQDIPIVGSLDEPSLEKVAVLQPDLIIGNGVYTPKIYDDLSKIAPTVFGGFQDTLGFTWRENFELYADALGKADEGKAMLDAWQERAATLGSELESAGVAPTVSMVRFLPGEIRIYLRDNFIGSILDEVGLPRPEQQDVHDFALYPSAERVDLMEGDTIFYGSYGPSDKSTQAEVTGDPLWGTLGAVKAGCSFEVDDDVWYSGVSITAANLVLDQLEDVLLEQGNGSRCATGS